MQTVRETIERDAIVVKARPSPGSWGRTPHRVYEPRTSMRRCRQRSPGPRLWRAGASAAPPAHRAEPGRRRLHLTSGSWPDGSQEGCRDTLCSTSGYGSCANQDTAFGGRRTAGRPDTRPTCAAPPVRGHGVSRVSSAEHSATLRRAMANRRPGSRHRPHRLAPMGSSRNRRERWRRARMITRSAPPGKGPTGGSSSSTGSRSGEHPDTNGSTGSETNDDLPTVVSSDNAATAVATARSR